MNRVCGIARWFAGLLLVAVVFSGPWVAGQTAEGGGAQVKVSAKTATQKPKVRQRSAAKIGKEFLTLLSKKNMPWQFYKSYADVFFDLNEKAQTIKPTNRKQAELLKAYSRYYEDLGNLVVSMAEQKRVIDGIALQNSSIPRKQQKEAGTAAKSKHEELLQIFITAFKNPPKKSIEGALRKGKK